MKLKRKVNQLRQLCSLPEQMLCWIDQWKKEQNQTNIQIEKMSIQLEEIKKEKECLMLLLYHKLSRNDTEKKRTQLISQALEKKDATALSKVIYPVPLSFCFDVSFACNLNCAGCDRFSCLCQNQPFPKKEEVFSSLEQIKVLFGQEIGEISLTGGEALLNPDLCEYIQKTRELFPQIPRIRLLTNGLLLQNRPDSFWETIRSYRISVNVSRYPKVMDYSALEAFLSGQGVEFYISDPGSEGKDFTRFGFDLSGSQNQDSSFLHCSLAGNVSNTLYQGRLYPCCISASVHWFNQAFDKSLPELEENSIDIFHSTREEILDFLSRPIPLCQYCDVLHRDEHVRWKKSKREITEWLP